MKVSRETAAIQHPSALTSHSLKVAALGAVLIALATFAAYGPALQGDFIWDDDAYVSENRLLVEPGGFWRIWKLPPETPQYYPLVFSSFWLEARLWGLSTFGLHAVNVALHAASAIVLWLLLARVGVPGAWLAGAIFALHPVHVESVAWITERKNVLSGLFHLLAFAAYLNFYRTRAGGTYAAALALFVGALLSKSVTCSLPAAILLVHWWRGERIDRRVVLALVPFFALGLIAGLNTAHLERLHVRAVGEEWDLSFLERILVAGRALWFYAFKLIWPAKLVFNYPRWNIDATAVWQYLYPASFLALLGALWALRHRVGRGPLVAVLFFALTLVPALGFFDVYPFRYSFVADHFQYHASIGLIALAAALITTGLLLAVHATQLRTPHSALRTIAAAGLLPLGLLTYRQCGTYANAETLWRRTIAANPQSWLAHFNLAVLQVERGELDLATTGFHRALEINPRCADAHWNLGNVAGSLDRHEEAMRHYRAALAIDPKEPTAHFNMARELERVGETEAAIAAYRECLANEPAFWEAHVNLGLLLLARGEAPTAWDHFQQALRHNPRSAAALHNLGMILESGGRLADAIQHYERALGFDPALVSAWFRVSVCYRKTGRLDEAEAALSKTLILNPNHVEAMVDLAVLNFERGRTERAIEGYRRAIALQPADVQVRINLSAALERAGRFSEAIGVLREGLAIENSLPLMHHLARILATCPDESIRNGEQAVALAEMVIERLDPARPEAFATLAAAYAETGDFDRARSTIERAIELAETAGSESLVGALRRQHEELEAGIPEAPRDPG